MDFPEPGSAVMTALFVVLSVSSKRDLMASMGSIMTFEMIIQMDLNTSKLTTAYHLSEGKLTLQWWKK